MRMLKLRICGQEANESFQTNVERAARKSREKLLRGRLLLLLPPPPPPPPPQAAALGEVHALKHSSIRLDLIERLRYNIYGGVQRRSHNRRQPHVVLLC